MNVRLPRSFVSKLVLRFLFSESSTTDENERMTTTKTTQHAANERTNERTNEREKERKKEPTNVRVGTTTTTSCGAERQSVMHLEK